MGTGMLLFPQMYQQLNQQPVQGVQQQGQQQQQAPQVMCPYCGGLNQYPYKFCKECGKPSPQQQAQAQPPQPAPQAQPAAAPAGGNTGFKVCPYCGESLAGLKKTPRFCPFCSEELS